MREGRCHRHGGRPWEGPPAKVTCPSVAEMPGTEGSCCACELRIDPQKRGQKQGRLHDKLRAAEGGGAGEASARGTGQQTVWRATCRWSTLGQKHLGSVNPRRQKDRGVGGQAGPGVGGGICPDTCPKLGASAHSPVSQPAPSSCRAPLCPLWGRERRGEGPTDVPRLAWSGMRRVRRAATGGSSSAGTGGVGRLARGAGG